MNNTRINSWIQQVCLHWMEHLPRSSAGFAESVAPSPSGVTEWREGPETVRTMLTQARVVYTFLRCRPFAGETFTSLDRLIRTFWDEEVKGWFRSCTLVGEPLDRTIDTYDQPFGLLALAEGYRACNKIESKDCTVRKKMETHVSAFFLRDLAYATLEGLDRFARDPYGGYWERRNGTTSSPMVVYPQYRRQNPHMHLLEAFLAWQEVDPQGPWVDHAREIVELFRKRFRSLETGYLAEYFDDQWNLADGEAGRVREPGHQYEWVWLLDWYQRLSGDPSVRKHGESLYRFAWEKGTDPEDGLAYAVVDDRGEVMDERKLLWPQTEMLKAHVVMYRWTGDSRYRAIAQETYKRIQKKFMRGESPIFYNLVDRAGEPDPSPALSRLLYHLYGGAVMAESLECE